MHDESTLVRPSRRLLSFFANYLNWYIGRHFHAIRLANSYRFPQTAGPLIVYANHASWWDPLAFIVISRYFFPTASHYAPMDAAALKYYALLRKLGIFPVEAGTRRGAAQFFGSHRRVGLPTCAPGLQSSVQDWQRWQRGPARARSFRWPSNTPFGMSASPRSSSVAAGPLR